MAMDTLQDASVPTRALVVGLSLLAVFMAVVQRLLRVNLDPSEPPMVPTKIPVIGHIIGMLWYGKKYYQVIQDTYGFDIYTLPLPGARQYIITSPALAAAVHRQARAISFRPFASKFARRMLLFSDEAHAVMERNMFDEDGPGLLTGNHDHLYASLPAGPALDELSSALMAGAAANLGRLSASASGTGTTTGTTTGEVTMQLYSWVRDLITSTSVTAFWGPDGPFSRDPTLLDAFWDLEDRAVAMGIVGGRLSPLLYPRAHRARARLTEAMHAFYTDDARWPQASWLLRERARIHLEEHGYPMRDWAKAEVGMLFGLIPNSTLGTFWTLARLLADRRLLEEVRAELLDGGTVTVTVVAEDADADGVKKKKKKAKVDMSGLRNRSPLLTSAFREMLRLTMPTSSVRSVRDDVLLGGRHLLRAGSLVMLDGSVMHRRRDVWGADADEYNPRRFLDAAGGVFTDGSSSSGSSGEGGGGGGGRDSSKRVHPAAFRGFGGGEVFCPGRNLAHVEVTGVAAAIVCAWELAPGAAEVEVPPFKEDEMPLGLWKPRRDVEVTLRQREGWEDVEWEYTL
ncbi:hypothetical protein GGTG_11442 [Gaeumannomyces tritici R3-111a-1]|uniref:Cytochrome P450 n=1 Tax=Gaeumannomyces tritici (strain R3-111a-1) TaxID=644352 RepID=J3PD73_GAET3|nr:hypothetical protein GGTG_11442 [Gaeumannomyces tritici R3-111a-1]EJT70418.1 hypothetical protein GGTG_11442 [Gaeumannomyces tritici R3-111a-1]